MLRGGGRGQPLNVHAAHAAHAAHTAQAVQAAQAAARGAQRGPRGLLSLTSTSHSPCQCLQLRAFSVTVPPSGRGADGNPHGG